jgi:hypothetical protein
VVALASLLFVTGKEFLLLSKTEIEDLNAMFEN